MFSFLGRLELKCFVYKFGSIELSKDICVVLSVISVNFYRFSRKQGRSRAGGQEQLWSLLRLFGRSMKAQKAKKCRKSKKGTIKRGPTDRPT